MSSLLYAKWLDTGRAWCSIDKTKFACRTNNKGDANVRTDTLIETGGVSNFENKNFAVVFFSSVRHHMLTSTCLQTPPDEIKNEEGEMPLDIWQIETSKGYKL